MSFFSIGVSCLPKFGIDEFAQKTHTYFYDWLISDLESLEKSLTEFEEKYFFNCGTEICDGGIRVKDIYTGLRFQHDFPSSQKGKIIPELVAENIVFIREKYLRRRKRFFERVLCDSLPIFIRYEWGAISSDCIERINRALEAAFKRDYRLIVISTVPSEFMSCRNTDFLQIEKLKDTPWRATEASWEDILEHCKSHFGT